VTGPVAAVRGALGWVWVTIRTSSLGLQGSWPLSTGCRADTPRVIRPLIALHPDGGISVRRLSATAHLIGLNRRATSNVHSGRPKRLVGHGARCTSDLGIVHLCSRGGGPPQHGDLAEERGGRVHDVVRAIPGSSHDPRLADRPHFELLVGRQFRVANGVQASGRTAGGVASPAARWSGWDASTRRHRIATHWAGTRWRRLSVGRRGLLVVAPARGRDPHRPRHRVRHRHHPGVPLHPRIPPGPGRARPSTPSRLWTTSGHGGSSRSRARGRVRRSRRRRQAARRHRGPPTFLARESSGRRMPPRPARRRRAGRLCFVDCAGVGRRPAVGGARRAGGTPGATVG